MPGRPACHADPANPCTRPRMATLPAPADTVVAHPLLVNTVIPTAARRDARERR